MKAVADYLDAAVAAVEDKWGAGSAERYPAIVAALVQAGAVNSLVDVVEHDVADALGELAREIGNVATGVGGRG